MILRITKAFSFLFLIAMLGCKEIKPETQKVDASIEVSVVSPEPVLCQKKVRAVGILSSKSQLKLSFKTGGIIQTMLVDEGEDVSEGQVLARLNLSEIESMVGQAKLAMEKAQRDYDRAKNLYRDSVATLEQLQNAETALDYSRTNMNIAEFNLKYSVIKAPAKGKILKRLYEENEMVAPGYPVFYFGSSESEWVVRCSIADKDIVSIQDGDSVSVAFDAYPNNLFSGIVTEIATIADPYTGTFEIEITIPKPDEKLVSGFIATVEIISSEKKPLFKLPINAMISIDNQNVVLVEVKDGRARKRVLKLSFVDNENLLLCNDSIADCLFVSEGGGFINDNDSVRIREKAIR